MSKAHKDTGADPIGDGKFRMFPSGDIVDYTERCKRLPGNKTPIPEGVFGLSWDEIQKIQGGKLTHR